MARYVVRFACPGYAGAAAVERVRAEMAAAGLLGLARYYPELGAGAFIELVREPEEIAALVAEEFALGEALVAIAAARARAAAILAVGV